MSDSRTEVFSALLATFSQGGEKAELAARQLFDLLWRKFVADFVRAGQPLGVAEELASDAFSKILRKLDTMRDPVAFEKWANTVARNTLLTCIRDSKAEREHEVALDCEPLALLYDRVADHRHGDPATTLCLKNQLEEFCRKHPERAYWLECWIFEGWSLERLAEAMERTLAAAKEHLSQCRKRLQS
jgi:RNA polymerase sigma-70 factor (ECF subfamily)